MNDIAPRCMCEWYETHGRLENAGYGPNAGNPCPRRGTMMAEHELGGGPICRQCRKGCKPWQSGVTFKRLIKQA